MNKALLLVAVVATLSVNTSYAQDLQPFDRMDVFELEWVSSPQISPDGKRIVYVRNGMDVMTDGKLSRLWLTNADGSNNLPLTGRDVDESRPAWSPDGDRIAFTSESENGTEIYVYWVLEGKINRLTQLDRSPGGMSWSPHGKYLAFSMLVPETPPVLVTAPANMFNSSETSPS